MIELHVTPMSTGEIRTYFVDFTNDLPASVTASSAIAALSTYPASGTATLSVGAIASNVVPVTVTTPTVAGAYSVLVTATLSDAEKSTARLYFDVGWASVRATALELISRLRGMTETTVNDYSVGAERYWSDYQLQQMIDHHADTFDWYTMDVQKQRVGAVYQYRQYYTGIQDWELSPVILDADAGTISTGYTFDAARGMVTFTADQVGSARYISGTAYNLAAAAADIWNLKAGHYASAYDVSTDNHNLSRSQLIKHCFQMGAFYNVKGGSSITLERGEGEQVTR